METTVDGLYSSLVHFGIVDYVSFVGLLAASVGIGIYYGFFVRKGDAEDYLVGGRNMGIVPIAMSLLATLISAVAIQGFPMEVYVYGFQISYLALGPSAAAFFLHWIFLPVICELKITSVNEYLEMRFNRGIRLLCSGIFIISTIFYSAMVLYGPVLGLEQVTNVSLRITAPIISLICIFYTCIGGLKAVVWTDFLQVLVILVAMLWINIQGTIDVGGFSTVWQRSVADGRVEWPSLSLDFSERHSLIIILMGGTFLNLSYNLNQTFMQRFMSLPSLRDARISLWIYAFGAFLIFSSLAYSGILLYAAYYACDPITTKLARTKDQIFPLFVMHTLGKYPGMAGLFISSIFSAGLSTLSTSLNSIAAVILEDFVKTFYSGPLSEKKCEFIMKGTVIVTGIITLLLVYVVENLGSILHVSFSLVGVTRGATLGMFAAGMLLPWVNSKGLAVGAVVGTAMTSWVFIGAQVAESKGIITYPEMPVSVEGCDYNFTSPNITTPTMPKDGYVLPIYQMSYLLYTPFGLVITLIVTILVSFLTGFTDPKSIDSRFLSSFVRRRTKQRCNASYKAIDLRLLDCDEIRNNSLCENSPENTRNNLLKENGKPCMSKHG